MSSFLSTQPYKGTRDFYPADMRIQNWMFATMSKVAESFGYEPYNGPMLEPFELYAAKSGEELVNQQLYWMIDRGERKLAVRPEMTPTLARMVAGKVNELPKPIRWYSIPNVWRYERPQRGRLREHWQLNVDVLGGTPLLADAEILSFALELMRAFGGEKKVKVQINNRRLMDRFFLDSLGVDAETALKVTKAIDAKNKIGPEGYAKWLRELGISESKQSQIEDLFKMSLSEAATKIGGEGAQEIQSLFSILEKMGYKDQIGFDPSVLRGLDYYTGTVFEMYDASPENNRAMFGGGRYDNLVGLFGNQKLSGVGLGLGDVTLRNFLETHGLLPQSMVGIDGAVCAQGLQWAPEAGLIAKRLREVGYRVISPISDDGFGAQLKAANKHHARFAVLLGESEWKDGKLVFKDLLTGTQTIVPIDQLEQTVKNSIK